MFRIAICDDEPLFLEKEKRMIEECLDGFDLEYKVDAFVSGAEMVINGSNNYYDLIMLDVEMPDMDGMEVARRLRENNVLTPLAFISAHMDYSTYGYHVKAVRYIVKNDDIGAYIEECIEHILSNLNLNNRLINIEFTVGKRQIRTNDILYLQCRSNYTYFVTRHTANEELRQRIPIKKVTKSLAFCEFVPISAKESVNMYHVRSVSRYKVALDNGESLVISQKKYNDVQDAFALFSQGKNL